MMNISRAVFGSTFFWPLNKQSASLDLSFPDSPTGLDPWVWSNLDLSSIWEDAQISGKAVVISTALIGPNLGIRRSLKGLHFNKEKVRSDWGSFPDCSLRPDWLPCPTGLRNPDWLPSPIGGVSLIGQKSRLG